MLRWHRLSALWKSWIFSQEPAEEQGHIPEPPEHEAAPMKQEGGTLKDDSSAIQNEMHLKNQDVDYKDQTSDNATQNPGFTNPNLVPKTQNTDLHRRSCSEPPVSEEPSSSCSYTPEGCGCDSRKSPCSEPAVDCTLQVDNGNEGDDGFLQREGSQRRSRRRFRRVNHRGERELITDGQEANSYNTVGTTTLLL